MGSSKNHFLVDPIPRSPVSQPEISPDGRRILFTLKTLNKTKDTYESHIWVVPSEGGPARQFTHGEGNDSSPLWSPDGREVLFLSSRGKFDGDGEEEKKTRLWIIPAYGGEARMLASILGGITRASWAPGSDRVLFLARAQTDGMSEGSSDVKVIRKLNYRRDGIGLFPDTRVHLFTVNAEGGEAKQLTEGEFDVVAAEWSPYGERIAFVANMTEDTDYTPMKDVWMIPCGGGETERLVEGIATRGTTHLVWSPDGSNLAYTPMDPVDPEKLRHRYTNLWVVPSRGGSAINLTEGFDRPVSRTEAARVEWSPDSDALFFIAHSHGSSHIYRVELETSEVKRVTDGDLTVQSFSPSRDFSTFAFCAAESTRLPEVYLQDGEGCRAITSFTDDLVKGLRVVEPEGFWFTASDGAEVQGWIMKPAGFEEGERYPTILQIHGGPWSNYGYSFNLLFQILSANGYSVVFINHRASTGYGESFANITGRWGDREYLDLMEAMDFVVETYPFVDPDRLGVGGCSGGGYLTNWIVTHTNKFKAAVTVASISNWNSFYGCSDLGPCHILNFWDLALGKEPWEEPEAYFKPSPIRYVDNVNTPLLIIHGEDDLRCPMEQAEQLFAALKKLKKTVEFVRFPGESHANVHTMKKPSHTTEALRHTLRWFNTYLK